jgi:hypothetical protein
MAPPLWPTQQTNTEMPGRRYQGRGRLLSFVIHALWNESRLCGFVVFACTKIKELHIQQHSN